MNQFNCNWKASQRPFLMVEPNCNVSSTRMQYAVNVATMKLRLLPIHLHPIACLQGRGATNL